MINTNDYAKLSANAYDGSFIPRGYTLVGQRFNTESGFAAFAYKHVETREIVIAIRGTELTDVGDLQADADIATGKLPQQYSDALAFYKDIARDNPDTTINVTGHSLGGALASLLAAETGVQATVFNALGTENVVNDPQYAGRFATDNNYANIHNYNAVFDPVSNLPLDQIGTVNTTYVDSFRLIPDRMEPIIAGLHPALYFYFLRDQHSIDSLVNASFTGAQTWRPRIDPFALDLDGDGIETIGVQGYSQSLYFDHNEDGMRTGTGWISADDGLLVLDRNGNGTIDDGTELFGDSTPIASGTATAADGFEALADLDANVDGKLDAGDAPFAHLRVWRDLNQDGVSQSDELFTLDALGITALNLDQTAVNQNLGNGNMLASTGTYTRTDGSIGIAGDVNLASNAFYREFGTSIALTEQAKTLPEMRGSGAVRDLREAASLSGSLAGTLTDYANAATREAQLALLDPLLAQWSTTSSMPGVVDRGLDAHFIVTYQFGTVAGASDPADGSDALHDLSANTFPIHGRVLPRAAFARVRDS